MARKKNIRLELPEIDTQTPENVKRLKQERQIQRKKRKHSRIIRRILIVFFILLILAIAGAYAYFYFTDSFKIQHVNIKGVEHLTREEMDKLADIPEDTTLLKVDTETIVKRLKLDAWIKDVDIVRVFPDTLEINVNERSIKAIVEVPTSASTLNNQQKNQDNVLRKWAISSDHMWLMPVPDKDTEIGKSINQQIYNDVEGVLHIVDVSPSVQPEIGSFCTDETVNCAIDVVSAMTTELKDQVKSVKATDAYSTNLFLFNGVEIAVGTSEDLRNKERVSLDLLNKYAGRISYINVRNPANPTWRTI